MKPQGAKYRRFEAMYFYIALLVCSFVSASVFAQEVVEVGGPISENTTWTNDYTYIVTDNLIVPTGMELVIMPGVVVKFQVNRGLQIYGSLKVMGSYQGEIDTVRFMSYEGQIWKGILFNSVSGVGNNIIDHAFIDKADIGVDIRYSSNVMVSHSSIQNGVTNDLRIFNSSACVISNNRMFKNGRVGLEIYATEPGNASSDNLITHNYISDSRYTNLLVRFDSDGVCQNNTIENNLFYGAEAGVYIDNSSFNSPDAIYIRGNVFYNNGGETIGFSISTGMDSTVITNNIFWQNTLTAVQLRRGNNGVLAQNSFYGNKNCISVNLNVKNAQIINNTITENSNYVTEINDISGLLMNANNIFNNQLPQGIVRNKTVNPLDIPGQYWGTTDTLAIDEMIWDYYDDGNLGELTYLPFYTVADTTAPMSPPFRAKRQLANGNTLLSWQANPEADLTGYAVYTGVFDEYRFLAQPIILTDTLVLVPGYQFNQTFAVTAFDKEGSGHVQLHSGHESPYAFVVNYPYAGPDTAICNNTGFYSIELSSVPFTYDALSWQSNGDGIFNNVQMLRPEYFPGPQDMERGRVTLTLNAQVGETVLSDAFKLTLSNIPFVYAGVDTMVSAGAGFSIQGAMAEYFEDLRWATTGDGVFNDSLFINPIYLMGPLDIENGKVTLVLTAGSACGVIMDTLEVLIREQFSVEGKVLSENVPVNGSVVLAIHSMDGYLPEIAQFTNSGEDGSFRFDKLFADNYWFYAIPDTSFDHHLMPTYYFGKQKWQSAYQLPLVADTYHVEIELNDKAYELPQGMAFISGRFELPPSNDEIKNYCSPWFNDDFSSYCDDGLSNVTIILYNDLNNIPLDYTLTDHEGRFIFNGLPYGKYIIDAEKPGFETTLSSMIELNREMPGRDNILLRIEQNRKIGVYVPEVPTPDKALTYPNPATDVLYFNPDCTGVTFEVKIFNMLGQQIFYKRYSGIENHSNHLNIADLHDGLYIGQFICNGSVQPFNFMVRH